MTARPTPAPGAPAPGAPGRHHPVCGTRTVIAKGRPGATCTLRFAIRTNDMDTAQSPRDEPGGQHDSDGGTRVKASLPADHDTVMARLTALPDNKLAGFVRDLDTALRQTRLGPPDAELAEITSVAASARILLRHRRATAAAARAKDIVRNLINAPETE